ncbi:MAG: hypothetical protein M3P34_03470 [Actinomycetota bacterium]|nr:hypothetical protein [Actinomycetota bacterium]
MAKKRNKRKARYPPKPTPAQRNAKTNEASEDRQREGVEELASFFSASWRQSRSGAISGRGYHYQDAVGSWLAVRAHVGDLECDRLVPEGLEDLTCEAANGWHVQAKSRQAHVGDFPLALAANHVLDAWERHRERQQHGQSERLAVVFEKPVAAMASSAWGLPLDEEPAGAGLTSELRQRAARRGMDAEEIAAMLAGTYVVVLPWRELDIGAATMVEASTGLPLAAAATVVLHLRAAVAERADRNAAAGWADRSGLSLTDIARLITEVAGNVDREALEEAIRSGICEEVDFDSPIHDDAYYEGASTQPGHVAAGLVVARPEATDTVLSGLDTRRAVLVAGPPGIGKSAVVWMAAYVARHIRWHRVNSLGHEDIEPLMRLARASGAGTYAIVGFVVDGVGVGALAAWDELRRAAASQAGVVLLGSVREEDMLPLATLGECDVVRPRLDEELAGRIHAGLVARGATAYPHWLEAFGRAEGLTLEYTHLLTRGRRLHEVVRDQVRARVRERRDTELALLAPVAFAHRWGASLNVSRLSSTLGASMPELKSALGRLIEEHLVTVTGDVVSGLHPLRSAALDVAIHEVPPPSKAETARIAVRTVCNADLASLLAGMVPDLPDTASPVLDELAAALSDPEWSGRLAAALHGLRLADFKNAARRWKQVLADHGVPLPIASLTLDLALLDSDLVDAFDKRLIQAVEEIRADPERDSSPLRDELLGRIGLARVAEELGRCSASDRAIDLLGALAGADLDLDAPEQSAPFAALVRDSELDALASLVQAGTAVADSVGAGIVALAGGTDAVLHRIRESDPFILDLEVVVERGEKVLRGRRLHVSDRLNPEPERAIKDLAVLGLSCLPEVARADLLTVWAGDLPMRIGDYEYGQSGLLRRYVHGTTAIAWNRARSNAALSMIAAESETCRLDTGRDILEGTAAFLEDLATTWVVSRRREADTDRLNSARFELLEDIPLRESW